MAVAIDEERMRQVLLSHEARVHRFGWDQTPQLFLVYDITNSTTDRIMREYAPFDLRFRATTRVSGYAAKAVITRFPGAPTRCLEALALGLAGLAGEETTGPMMQLLRLPGVQAIGWVEEAWTKVGGRDILEAVIHHHKSIKNMPGRKEQRVVFAIDLTHRLHVLARTRGDRPEMLDQPSQFHGAHTTPLRMIMAAVTDTVPPREEWPLAFPDLADLYQPVGSPLRERDP